MPINSLDEQMIMDLHAAGENFKDCPVLKGGANQAEEEIHKAMVNNWRTKLFLSWQTMQNSKPRKISE